MEKPIDREKVSWMQAMKADLTMPIVQLVDQTDLERWQFDSRSNSDVVFRVFSARKQNCPLLLRVFLSNQRHHMPNEFAKGQTPSNE